MLSPQKVLIPIDNQSCLSEGKCYKVRWNKNREGRNFWSGKYALNFYLMYEWYHPTPQFSLFALYFRLLSMKTKNFKAATMTVIVTVQISTCTWIAATPLEWKEAPGLCMKGPILLGTCTSYLGASTQNTSIGWASMIAWAPAGLFIW